MVQIHLGHVSLKSTQRYSHITHIEVASEVRDRLNYAFRLEEEIEEIGGPAPEQSGRGGIRLKWCVFTVSRLRQTCPAELKSVNGVNTCGGETSAHCPSP